MSILKREKVENEEEIYFNFINSLKSEVTKKTYERYINLFMEFSNVARLSNLLAMPEPQKQIIKYIMSLREKRLAFNSISLSLCAIYHFYDMNDVILNKKKINMFKGEFEKRAKDRAYTHEEIKKKKYYDKQGHEINDPDLIAEVQRGATVISYHEEKPK